ncbi:universal stress protein [Halomonas sp. RA08-2]|uniref:universal stress protein n=1 Tax=Halomonas sp. RA08-2 TaxID=3440842 RepID=UPI003EEFBC74
MNHGIRRILCCVGLRNDCDSVLTQAVGFAVATGAELDVLHAVKALSDDVVSTLRDYIPDRGILKNSEKTASRRPPRRLMNSSGPFGRDSPTCVRPSARVK